jgi:membrane-bound ClpP family serine protease
LHTGGGDIDQAERLVKLIRTRTCGEGQFRVIVPNSAKSAGTLIAVASDVIMMGEQSELGPIDPQIAMHNAAGVRIYRPAQSILDGLDHIASQGNPDLPQAYFPLLQQLDPALIDFCRKALKRSEKFAYEFLSSYMLKGNDDKAKEIASTLNDAKAYLSHGAVIDAESAINLGLNVDFREPDDRIWRAIWSLYLQLDLALPSIHAKIFEGERVSLIPS